MGSVFIKAELLHHIQEFIDVAGLDLFAAAMMMANAEPPRPDAEQRGVIIGSLRNRMPLHAKMLHHPLDVGKFDPRCAISEILFRIWLISAMDY